MRRIARIAGRLDDELMLGGVRVLPGQIEAVILRQEALAPLYQLVVSQEGGGDRLAVQVEASPRLAADQLQRKSVAAALQGAIREATGVDAAVQIGDPGSLARSQGRATRVRDLRPPPAA
jgi:phenylacetate-CoA ligase